MYFVSLLTFLDPPRPDTRHTLLKAAELGISVKMLTGDHHAIAVEMSRTLGLGDRIKVPKSLPALSIEEMSNGKEVATNLGRCYGQLLEDTDGFAQVMPEHKYLIVESLRQRGHVVGMTGDGVNDAPALKRSDVGVAVCNATQAAQAASDIVLTRPGLRTVVLAVYTSRKIFQRMKNFVIYRVACTQQLLLFFFISCLCFHPQQVNSIYGATYFSIPVIALVSITILNDGTMISVAYDNVQASRKPERWNLPVLYIVSTAIGTTALASSFLLLHLALHGAKPGSCWRWLGLGDLRYEQVQTLLYLKISLTDYASVFNSRCQGWMWSRAPSSIVLASAAFAMALSTFLSVWCPPGMMPISWNVAAFTWVYVLAWAVIQDVVKVLTYKLVRRVGLWKTLQSLTTMKWPGSSLRRLK